MDMGHARNQMASTTIVQMITGNAALFGILSIAVDETRPSTIESVGLPRISALTKANKNS